MKPHFLTMLAHATGKRGQIGEGLALVAEALAVISKTEDHVYESELYRLKGELLRQKAKSKKQKVKMEAQACFQRALEITRQQEAKSLELRAAMSLARLW